MATITSPHRNGLVSGTWLGGLQSAVFQWAVPVSSQAVRLWSVIAEKAGQLTRAIAARGKVHHVYFVLAGFDLVAVGSGLYLNHQVNSAFTRALEVNVSWSRRFAELESLRESTDGLVAPAYSVFGSERPEREKTVFGDNAEKVRRELGALRSSIEALLLVKTGPARYSDNSSNRAWEHEHVAAVLERLIAIERSVYSLMDCTGALIDHHIAGNAGAATSLVSDVDRWHLALRRHIDALLKELREAEHDLEGAQFAEAQGLGVYEYVLGLMILWMVCGVTLYGHWLGKLFQRRYDQLQEAHAAARKAEGETRAYAEQLEAAHEDIIKLNAELADSIEKLKSAQDEIVRKGKLAQLGQLTATVAHEIRNPLGAVRTASFLVERKVKDKGLGVESQLQRINNGIKRCDTIITELLDFARSKSLTLEDVVLDTWVRATVEEEQKTLPRPVQVAMDLDLGDVGAAIDTGRMRRVLINLLSNASEAMVGKGMDIVTQSPRIRVTTRRVGGNVEIEVADNGPGISEENLKKILEPLFTTKSFGVGLGLPAVEKILEQHGGGLRIASTLGEGAVFTAFFPLATTTSSRKAA
jgi:signal transduction histidine kinase